MVNLKFQEELAQLNRKIGEVEVRLVRHADLIARLAADGYDTAFAQKVLETMQRMLAAHQNRRDLILREIAGQLENEA